VNERRDVDPELQAVTIRLPRNSYLLLREHAESQGASLNTVLREAVAQYQTRVERERAVAGIRAFQQQLRADRGLTADSVDLLRELRETQGRSRDHEADREASPR